MIKLSFFLNVYGSVSACILVAFEFQELRFVFHLLRFQSDSRELEDSLSSPDLQTKRDDSREREEAVSCVCFFI